MSRLSRRKFLGFSGALAAAALGRRFASACPPVPGEAVAKLVAGNTRFALDLYGQLRGEPGDAFLSPFSVSAALAMTAAGARGNTLTEMARALHLPENPHAAFGSVIGSLNDEPQSRKARGFDLSVANALWAQQGYPWREEYKTLVTTDYRAGLTDVDFRRDAEAARKAINAWVAKETREKIKELLGQGTLTPMTRLVLTNAVYFKGTWAAKFDKQQTKDQPFRLSGGKTATVPLMFQAGAFSHAEGDGYQVVELPYAGDRLSMVVVLPHKPGGLPAVEQALTADRLADDLKKLRREPDLQLHLPRFKVEAKYNLIPPLRALGVRDAFQSAVADFTGMHTGRERLFVEAVVHQAVCEVNEEGTEAAGATGVVVSADSARRPVEFRADRPFLFLIRDVATKGILFLGRVTNPGR